MYCRKCTMTFAEWEHPTGDHRAKKVCPECGLRFWTQQWSDSTDIKSLRGHKTRVGIEKGQPVPQNIIEGMFIPLNLRAP